MAAHNDGDEHEVVSCMVTQEIKCVHTVCDSCLCDEIPLNIYNSCEPKYYIIYSIY